MNPFSFYNPTKVHFGGGTIRMLGKELNEAGIGKVILVAGSGSIKKNNVYHQVTDTLGKYKIKWIEAWGVRPNPELPKALEILELARKEKVDAILAVGGGSVIDTSKAVAAGFYLNNLWDAFLGKEQITNALPIYTVLTLSATGSEMNANAVLSKPDAHMKLGVFSPYLYPKLSIIDPTVQCSLPFAQTVNGALDAMAHILEYQFADDTPHVTLAINEALLKTIMACTDNLKTNPCDIVSRGNLAWSATLALNGISGIGLKGGDWACHQIEHALSAFNPNIAHGEGLGVIFPAWMEYMSEKDPCRFQRWARNVWDLDSPIPAIKRFREKICSWGAATSLRDLCIKESNLQQILDLIMKNQPIGAISKFTAVDIQALLMLAF
ncbi:MAG: iron-containing alcohol dehydrogenase [Candidatus Cloacimonetes bacterium]|nr:iron-containing alcohol dehydrogenase [Candidatus Cloacimonadota bacterium]